MGAGKTLRQAIANVRALPPDAPERLLALPILVRLRLEIPADPAKQTKSDREFLMSTQDVDKFLEQLRQEGRQEGRDEGFAQAVLAAYRARFGAPPAGLVVAVEYARNHAALQRWLEIVTTRSVDEITEALRRPRSAQPARRAGTRRSASPRRTSVPR